MRPDLRKYRNMAFVSLIPFLLFFVLFTYYLTWSISYSIFLGVVLTVTVWILKRRLLFIQQKKIITPLLSKFDISQDRTEIQFESNEEWECGLFHYSKLKFYCMLRVTSEGVYFKLPAFLKNKIIFIDWELIEGISYVNESVDKKSVTAELSFQDTELHKISIPWNINFDKFCDTE